MKTNYLFPHRFRTLSGALFVLALATLVAYYSISEFGRFEFKMKVFAIADGFLGEGTTFSGVETSVFDELLMLLVIPFGLMFAFSKERLEDEMVAAIRLNSLAWATITNYLIILFCYLFIFGLPFLNVLLGAMLSQLVIFIILFRFKMYRFNNSRQDEE